METWAQAEILIDGQFKKVCDAFSAHGDPCREWVELSDGRLASTRCSVCTFMHGPPENRYEAISVAHPGVPEDIAIWGAKLLLQLRYALTRIDRRLCPADVVRTAEKFDAISPGLATFVQEPSPTQAWALLSMFESEHVVPAPSVDKTGVPGSASIPADSPDMRTWEQFLQDHYADFSDFLECLNCVVKAFREKVHKAKTSWKIYGRPYKRRPYLAEVPCYTELNETYTKELLKRAKLQAPVFTLIDGDMSFKPRFTRGFANDCQCNTPWHERSLWERQPWVAYELPLLDAGLQFGCQVPVVAVAGLISPASGSAEDSPHNIASRATFKQDFAFPHVGNRVHEGGAAEDRDNRQAETTEKQVVPTSCSAVLQHQLLAWTSEDEAASEASETHQGSEDVENDETCSEERRQEERSCHEASESGEGGQSESESSRDVDDPEGYCDCPQTPPSKTRHKRHAELGQSVQKEAQPKFATGGAPTVEPVSDSSAKLRRKGSAASEGAALTPTSGSVVCHQEAIANDSRTHKTLLAINAHSQRELLERHPQLRQYAWSSGQCSMCMEWRSKAENTFVITHSCGVVHCGWCYEDHQGECMDPGVAAEIQATREALFEKHPELRVQTPISGQCAHCLEEVSVVHQFLFQHCCGTDICSDCYVHHLPYCEGGFCYDAFVLGDDESSDDYGIPYGPDVRDETW